MTRSRVWSAALPALLSGAAFSCPGAAQTLSVAPTYQMSVTSYNALFPRSEFQALGSDCGVFQPHIFGRYQTLGPTWFWTLGVEMTFQVRWEALFPEGSPWDRQGP